MKKIAISVRNRIFSESVFFMLRQTGKFNPVIIPSVDPYMVAGECVSQKLDLLFMDVVPETHETGLGARLKVIDTVHEKFPECRNILLWDETAYPELTEAIMRARTEHRIDAFFNASVTAKALTAALNSM